MEAIPLQVIDYECEPLALRDLPEPEVIVAGTKLYMKLLEVQNSTYNLKDVKLIHSWYLTDDELVMVGRDDTLHIHNIGEGAITV